MSNGEDIILRCALKPIPTLGNPLASINMNTKKPTKASVQRSDVCVVPAAGIVGQGMVAFEICKALLEKFGSDNLEDIKNTFNVYIKGISRR